LESRSIGADAWTQRHGRRGQTPGTADTSWDNCRGSPNAHEQRPRAKERMLPGSYRCRGSANHVERRPGVVGRRDIALLDLLIALATCERQIFSPIRRAVNGPGYGAHFDHRVDWSRSPIPRLRRRAGRFINGFRNGVTMDNKAEPERIKAALEALLNQMVEIDCAQREPAKPGELHRRCACRPSRHSHRLCRRPET
jgi:hypothetical protein